MNSFELSDYLSILKRRKKLFFAVFVAIFLLSLLFALSWSNYRSVATLEVAPPQISSNTTIPQGMNVNEYTESLVDSRINHIQQRVLSTSSLIEIITKFDLYPSARKQTPIAAIAESMYKKIKLELVDNTLGGKKSQSGISAITFNLSFDYSNPLICQQVTNELVTRFIDEDLKERRKVAHETSTFLDTQIKTLEQSLAEQEKKISEFRAKHKDVQPESLSFNQQAAQSMMLNIQNIDTQIATNEGTIGSLRGQLASIDPYSRVVSDGQILSTPTIQLKALKTQYSTLSAQYGSAHPDVIKIRKQISALQKQVGSSAVSSSELKVKITDTKSNLAAAEKSYGANHPDVKALQSKLAKLEKELANVGDSKDKEDNFISDADNPAYLQVVASLKATEEQHKSLMKQKDKLIAQQEKYQDAVAANPEAMAEMAILARDYDNAQLRYRGLKEKQLSADMSETIEQDRNGQRLIIVNPPELPLKTQPRRIIFLFGGLFLSLVSGVMSVAVSQLISQSVVGARHLESIAGTPPLVTVFKITTEEKKNTYKTLFYSILNPLTVSRFESSANLLISTLPSSFLKLKPKKFKLLIMVLGIIFLTFIILRFLGA